MSQPGAETRAEGGARAVDTPDPQRTLRTARRLLASLSEALEAEIGRLGVLCDRDPSEAAVKTVQDLIRQAQKALQSVLDWETRLARDADALQPDGGTIDLEAAREEITRRLARLAERG